RGAQRARRIGRQAPVLSLWIELVGRRAAGGLQRVGLAVGPDLGAAAVGAEREIDIEADRHAALVRAALHGVELRPRGAVHPFVELDALGILLRKFPDGARAGIAVFARPVLPASAVLLAQRFEDGEGAGPFHTRLV